MRKHFIRAICILGVLVVLFSCCPLSAFAVDPVSASVIANSFAQAIAAYGASNGVAMTFDVGSTDGIGETVHELWKNFREGTQTADDYDTLAAALFPDLYYKALNAVGTAAEAYSVGVNITSEYAEEFDNFYNWLLSGPAEMVQVDNQYYQFSQSQIGNNATAIVVGSVSGFPGQPLYISFDGSSWQDNYNYGNVVWRGNGGSYGQSVNVRFSTPQPAYCFLHSVSSPASNSYAWALVAVSLSSVRLQVSSNNNGTYSGQNHDLVYDSTFNCYTYSERASRNAISGFYFGLPVFDSYAAGVSAALSYLDGTAVEDTIGVKAYDSVGVAEFPDTADPNYDATHRAKSIPLDIPWDDTLFGDGTGDLTDAQSGAIAGEVADVLAADEVIPLVGEAEAVNPRPDPDDDDASGDPDDYAVLGLEDIFPFCIPFDIYAFLSALASDPVAPSFTCTFDFPEALGGTQTLELDFDTPTFNQLAQLLRLLELLAFIVGLALLTRSMFIRG